MPTQRGLTIPNLKLWHDKLRACMKGTGDYSFAFAGGCVRDILLNREVKDLDLFIQIPYGWDTSSAEDAQDCVETAIADMNLLLMSKAVCKSDMTIEEAEAKYGAIKIQNVWHYENAFNDVPMDVIFLNEHPADYIKAGFDLGICQAWVGFYGIRTTEAFRRDLINKTMTFLLGEDRRADSRKHFERITHKYPGWRYLSGKVSRINHPF